MPFRAGDRVLAPIVLAGLAGAWLVFAAGYIQFIGESTPVAYPGVVAGLFLAAAAAMGAFIIRPQSHLLYTWAGALSATAITSRGLSIVAGALINDRPNTVGVIAINTVAPIVLVVLFWLFWQRIVRGWVRDLTSGRG